eukprot:5845244-Pleurochrysis_carterae.AAC.1
MEQLFVQKVWKNIKPESFSVEEARTIWFSVIARNSKGPGLRAPGGDIVCAGPQAKRSYCSRGRTCSLSLSPHDCNEPCATGCIRAPDAGTHWAPHCHAHSCGSPCGCTQRAPASTF